MQLHCMLLHPKVIYKLLGKHLMLFIDIRGYCCETPKEKRAKHNLGLPVATQLKVRCGNRQSSVQYHRISFLLLVFWLALSAGQNTIQLVKYCNTSLNHLSPVVQRVENAIHRVVCEHWWAVKIGCAGCS